MAKKAATKKKDNRLTILLTVAIVVVLGFTAIYFINKSQNEAKIDNSTSASDQKTSEKATGNTDTHGLYGDYKPKAQATIDQLGDKNYQNIILPDDLQKKIDAGEETYAYFFSPTCSHCVATTPILMPAADKADVHIYQYNMLEFEQGWDDYAINATPTLIYFKDGKEVGRVIGEQTAEAFKEFFKTMKNS